MVLSSGVQWRYIEENLRTSQDWDRLNFAGEIPGGGRENQSHTNDKVALVCIYALEFFEKKMPSLIDLRQLPPIKIKVWNKRKTLLKLLENKLFEILPGDGHKKKPNFSDFFEESLAQCIVYRKQIYVFRCLTYLNMGTKLLPREEEKMHVKLKALTTYNHASLACRCLLDWIRLDPSTAIPRACELFKTNSELFSAKKVCSWFTEHPEVKKNLKVVLTQLIKANLAPINSQLRQLVAYAGEQFTFMENIRFLNCAKRVHNQVIFRFLLITLFDLKEPEECRKNLNKHIKFLSQILVLWIENAPAFLPTCFKQTYEESSSKKIIQETITELLNYTNFSIVRSPYYPEPILDSVGLYRRHIKKTAFCAALLRSCFSSQKEIQKRGRWVAEHIACKDTSFELLYRNFHQMSQKGASSLAILTKFKKVLAIRTTIGIPLIAHIVTPNKRQLFAGMIKPQLTISKEMQSAWKMKILCHEFFKSENHAIRECLAKIATLEGFSLKAIKSCSQWFRDVFFPLHNGSMLVAFAGPIHAHDKALETSLKAVLPKNSAYFASPPLQQHLMGHPYQFSARYFGWMHLKEKVPFNWKEATFYFEGGNLLRVINRKNEVTILCGALNLLCAYFVAEINQTFVSLDMKRKVEKKVDELLEKGVIQSHHLEETKRILKILNENEKSTSKDAYQAIAKIEVIRDVLQEELQHPMLVLESGFGFHQSQLELHIDMYILPAPNGVVFLQSYELTVSTLHRIIENGRLTFIEQKVLNSFLKYAKILQNRDEKRLLAILKQLEQLDVTVIQVPGIYVDEHFTINYLNAIVGQGNTGNFAITNGFKGIPGEDYLRDAFTLMLQAGGIDSVYFEGHDLEKTMETTPDWDLESLRMIQLIGGIHCRSLELFSD
ncbi:MAG: hypothetical protein CK425_03495 [Parachlamydia sp.]|nr:MAG: hypothetical protein CK425_03495 [Parachlamydia sp.]